MQVAKWLRFLTLPLIVSTLTLLAVGCGGSPSNEPGKGPSFTPDKDPALSSGVLKPEGTDSKSADPAIPK